MRPRRKLFHVVLEPGEDKESEWFVATSPDLPGLVTQGRGIDETVENVKDAISAFHDGHPPTYTLEVRVVVPV